ncbi:hypothetical protein EVAR_6650_1 [Eumeta japonica]|uniref:Uncharacterized protein n=1 Tax=Eumeta variegata TaxID=151549 RepID=A0A4C1TLR2_EUMVA|nr:hypothetical protein EVAR_6650_1 [Eumeta japonica]
MEHCVVTESRKKVTLNVNYGRLDIRGNRCVLRVGRNEGTIVVTGSECKLEIEENCGAVHVRGPRTSLKIGKRLFGDRVHISGPNCKLMDADLSDKVTTIRFGMSGSHQKSV